MGTALNTILMITVALLTTGVINRTRAILAGRKGVRFFNHVNGVALLLRKGSVYSTTTTSLFRIAPDRLGRVLSIYFSLGVLPAMLAVLGTGALADGIGIERTFVVAGSVIVLLGTAGLLLPEVVALDRRKR